MLKDKEYERDDLFIEMQLCIKKLNYMLNTTIERYGFNEKEITSREEAMKFAYNKTSVWWSWKFAWIISRKLSRSKKNWRRWVDMGCRKEIIEMIEKIENARWLRTIYVFIKTLVS